MVYCVDRLVFLVVHSPVDGHLNCLQFMAIINECAVKSTYKIHISVCGQIFSFLLSKGCGMEWLAPIGSVSLYWKVAL